MPAACLKYLKAVTELSLGAFIATHSTTGLPGKGSEIGSVKLHNTKMAVRNVFIREGRLMLVISYNKARASNNHAFYIMRYFRADLAAAIFTWIAYIQPLADFLAAQLQLPQYHSSEFLFPDPSHKKRHLSSLQASNALKRFTTDLQTP